jgi:glycosyltransferase involved in cell wall biosynthesis
LPEMIDDGVTGLLVPPRDVRKLADAIVALLRDDALRCRMGLAGERKIEGTCSPAVVAQETFNVYRIACLGRQRSATGASAHEIA